MSACTSTSRSPSGMVASRGNASPPRACRRAGRPAGPSGTRTLPQPRRAPPARTRTAVAGPPRRRVIYRPCQPSMPPSRPPLVDTHGRTVRDLRISVTDRCNLRCVYCMPAEGMPWLPALGPADVRGAHALRARLRRVRRLGRPPDRRRADGARGPARARAHAERHRARPGPEPHDQRAQAAEARAASCATAGLRRVNVSLDTLSRERFHRARAARPASPTTLRRARGREARRLRAHQDQRRADARPQRRRGRCRSPAGRASRASSCASSSGCRSTSSTHVGPLAARDRRRDPSRSSPPRSRSTSTTGADPSAPARTCRYRDGARPRRRHRLGDAPVLRPLRPHPPHRRRPDPHLPVRAPRVRLPRR